LLQFAEVQLSSASIWKVHFDSAVKSFSSVQTCINYKHMLKMVIILSGTIWEAFQLNDSGWASE